MDIEKYIDEFNKTSYIGTRKSGLITLPVEYDKQNEKVSIGFYDVKFHIERQGKTCLFYKELKYTNTLYIDYYNFEEEKFYTKAIRLKKGKPISQLKFNNEIIDLINWCRQNLNIVNKNLNLSRLYYKGDD